MEIEIKISPKMLQLDACFIMILWGPGGGGGGGGGGGTATEGARSPSQPSFFFNYKDKCTHMGQYSLQDTLIHKSKSCTINQLKFCKF